MWQSSPADADTLIWLATADEPGASTGGYFYQCKKRAPHAWVEDADGVDRLWVASDQIVEKAGP